MLKHLSVTALVVATTIATPLATFAQHPGHENNGNRGRQEQVLNLKRKVDVNVSLTGKVTVVNGTMLTLVATNGSTYSVDSSSAKFTRRFGGAMNLGDIQVNDQLYVVGTLTGTVVKAKTIQNLSLQTRNGEFTGTIKSLSSNSFVLTSQNRGDQTINMSTTTKIMKNGEPTLFADLMVGATVKVDGVWDRTNSNVTARKVMIVVKPMDVRLDGTVGAVTAGSTASLTLNATDGKSYRVDLTKAQLLSRGYFGTDMGKIRVGDTVQVSGRSETSSLNVKAQLVVDFSL